MELIASSPLYRICCQLHDPDKPWMGRYGSYEAYNALYSTLLCGLRSCVQKSLEGSAGVNAQGGRYGNALQAATALINGHHDVVETLLQKGADVNAQGGQYGNALQAASYRRHGDVIELLITCGAKNYKRLFKQYATE